MAVPWKSPGNIPSAELNGSTSYLSNSTMASVPGTGSWDDLLYIIYKYMTQNRRGGKGEGYNVEASCNPSFPPLLNWQPVNPGTCIPSWKNHMQFNSWEFAECLRWFSHGKVSLQKQWRAWKKGVKGQQYHHCVSQKKIKKNQTPNQENLKQTNKKIPTTTTKTTKKKPTSK